MPIYTKRGDRGKTSLFDGTEVPKDDLHIEAFGCIDELNTMLGLVLSFSDVEELKEPLSKIQNDLFIISSELAAKRINPEKAISLSHISYLEEKIDLLENKLPSLHNFILPGGSKTASLLHLARAISRRAERAVVALSRKEKINPFVLTYMNRVSDLLFMEARYVNYKKKIPEKVWKRSIS